MKFDFDTFEFVGLIAPGAVLVVLIAILYPHLLRTIDSAVTLTLAVFSAYLLGHIVGAIGKIIEPLLKRMGMQNIDDLSVVEWSKRGYITKEQSAFLEKCLNDSFAETVHANEEAGRRVIAKQMYLTVVNADGPNRLETFAGLSSLCRGMVVSLLLAMLLSFFAHRYLLGAAFLVAAGLMVSRLQSFNGSYSRELLQQFCFVMTRSESMLNMRRFVIDWDRSG